MGLSSSTAYKWAVGEPEPEYDDGNPTRLDFQNKDDLKIATYLWPSKKGVTVRGSVLLIHGIDGHARWDYLRHCNSDAKTGKLEYFAPTYDGSWIETLNKNGFHVFGLDQQSYGRSESHADNTRSFFHSFDDLVDDILQFKNDVYAASPQAKDGKLFIMGDSLGGCATLRTCEMDQSFGGAVVIAPMMSLEAVKEKPINKIMLPFVNTVSEAWPTLALGAKQDNLMFPEDHQMFMDDPMCYAGWVRARVAAECLRIVEQTRSDIAKVESPVILFHSKGDTMCEYHGSEFVHDNASSKDKTLRLLDNGMWHALMHEPGNQEILKEIVAWLKARTTG